VRTTGLFEEKEQRESPSCDVGPSGTAGFLVVIKCSATYRVRLRGEEKEEEKRRDREERRAGRECAARSESRGDPE